MSELVISEQCSVGGSNLLVPVLQHKSPLAPSAGFSNCVKCVLFLRPESEEAYLHQLDNCSHVSRQLKANIRLKCVCVCY